jgi:hypothetical protein
MGVVQTIRPVIVVSGLPRSGTSLMMQMLASAGVPLQQDGVRAPDVSNLRGYFEWDEIKQLPRNPGLIGECEGKAVKIISSLLMSLPAGFDYRILFMERRVEDVLASQTQMIARLGTRAASLPERQMVQALAAHRSQVVQWLEKSGYRFEKVEFEKLFSETLITTARITRFLGLDKSAITAMSSVIEPQLWHNGSTLP